ncbi:hypothetical protein [Rhizobium sp. L1K21]|uniref:hypothetical protein n=1 Tax=Rhizobium sp. L1K21 TaxID=2954933 RepID=UPI002093BCEA|nr:hypothetical protein [Rhizobium sp. L1K21]MCO6185012.1 hypothetical protein [Rhizobium sp. L1K21]
MRNFNHYTELEFTALGELDSGLVIYTRGERMDLVDVWPGKLSDIQSLERNAAAFRRQERRRFFRYIGRVIAKPFRAWQARRAENRAYREFLRVEYRDRTAQSARNNFTDILAATCNTALYKDQIPTKDYRDD